jgi:hypothetical protein
MSKRIITNLLIVVALLAPLTVFANIENVNENARLVTLVESKVALVASEKMPAQITSLTQVDQVASKAHNQLRPLPTDVWLLSLALLGFVLLSNRSVV